MDFVLFSIRYIIKNYYLSCTAFFIVVVRCAGDVFLAATKPMIYGYREKNVNYSSTFWLHIPTDSYTVYWECATLCDILQQISPHVWVFVADSAFRSQLLSNHLTLSISSQKALLATFVLHYKATNISTVKFSCQALKSSNWEQQARTQTPVRIQCVRSFLTLASGQLQSILLMFSAWIQRVWTWIHFQYRNIGRNLQILHCL